MARKKKYGCGCGRQSFYLTNEDIAKITKISIKLGITKSQVINVLLNSYFELIDAKITQKAEKEADYVLHNT